MSRQPIATELAPGAIGTYSQAMQHGSLLFLSGQIPLDPVSMDLIEGDFADRVRQVFDNLDYVAKAAGGSINDAVKLTIYLTDMANFPIVNEVMAERFEAPYPARAAIGVASLPKGTDIEADAIVAL
ncbi:MAG: Rid family detoxifying hydrolase [Pseudomonadota bacterium]